MLHLLHDLQAICADALMICGLRQADTTRVMRTQVMSAIAGVPH